MDDLREKVIKGLKYCIDYGKRIKDICNDVPCEGCPYCKYRDIRVGYGDCIDTLHSDAIEILKAQEPRVMTLEELLALPEDTPVFIEENNGECGWNVFYGIDEENDVCFCGFRASADYYNVEEYGMFWRCWTSRPTDEQRKAAKWDE